MKKYTDAAKMSEDMRNGKIKKEISNVGEYALIVLFILAILYLSSELSILVSSVFFAGSVIVVGIITRGYQKLIRKSYEEKEMFETCLSIDTRNFLNKNSDFRNSLKDLTKIMHNYRRENENK